MTSSEVTLFDSPIFAAIISGSYLATFHVTNNISMLMMSSVLLIAVVFILPITVAVIVSSILVSKTKYDSYQGFVAIFFCALYLAVGLRNPILNIEFIKKLLDLQSENMVSVFLAKLSYFLLAVILATLLGVVCRKYLRIYTIALCVMTFAAFVPNLMALTEPVLSRNHNNTNQIVSKYDDFVLKTKPNIYLIVADGYGSFEFLEKSNIDVSVFKNDLMNSGFRLYDDVFSNYQPTLPAMSAMLEMEHHYYRWALKHSEISKKGRKIIGGRNNFVSALKENGYQIDYIHQGAYLLFQGCSVDHCNISSALEGAKYVLNQTLPRVFQLQSKDEISVASMSLKDVREDVVNIIASENYSEAPHFQYIHLFRPAHVRNDVEGTCDELQEITLYSERVSDASHYLRSLVNEIIARDREAFVILVGDHGPMISNNCSRNAMLTNIHDFRDRAGALAAIRWPEKYQGVYDDRILTTINMLRFVLTFLAVDPDKVLDGLVPDDVYVSGPQGHYLVVKDGKVIQTSSSDDEPRDEVATN